ncbi:MAG: 50S ribosomal protein L21 [Gammaproteobacteria bacterium]|nr:50S ribosomal protein L21 [Gammaproteobacteria bacterium]
MQAVIKTGGKQYSVSVGDKLTVESLPVEAGAPVEFSTVLLVKSGDTVTVGTPTIEGAKVLATVIENGRGPKVRIVKFKRRKHYRKQQGHRQNYTKIEINEIVGG